jgi:tRNA dimethylallyltransferase
MACQATTHHKLPQVLVITGPTAVGKTAIGLELAKLIDGEVISADSVQVYRHLDIGSDKLPMQQRKGIRHHLIDIMNAVGADGEPNDYSAGDFHDQARAAVEEILSRGKVPIVVGGTGFYLKFFTNGKTQGPKASPEATAHVQKELDKVWREEDERLRAMVEKEGGGPPPEDDPLITAQSKWEIGCKLLEQWGDPESYQRILLERNNYYRLERALALIHMTGKKLSELDTKPPPDGSKSKDLSGGHDQTEGGLISFLQGSIGDGTSDFRLFFLHRSRSELYERISSRCEEMVFLGLLDEAAMMMGMGLKSGSSSASRSIGYRQAMTLLESLVATKTKAETSHLQQLVRDIIHATHKLVRNQMTYFRDDSTYRWLELESGVTAEQASQWILERLGEPCHEGGCGSASGRLTREEEQALKRYRPNLPRFEDAQEVKKLIDHINDDILPKLIQ